MTFGTPNDSLHPLVNITLTAPVRASAPENPSMRLPLQG